MGFQGPNALTLAAFMRPIRVVNTDRQLILQMGHIFPNSIGAGFQRRCRRTTEMHVSPFLDLYNIVYISVYRVVMTITAFRAGSMRCHSDKIVQNLNKYWEVPFQSLGHIFLLPCIALH